MDRIDSATLLWLLEAEPWVQYHTRRDLLDEPENAPGVQEARRAMAAHPQVQALLTRLADWPGPALKSHRSADAHLHTLVFLADLGFTLQDGGVGELVQRVTAEPAPEGPFQVLLNIPTHFGGSGQDEPGWMLCDAPLLAYAVERMGGGSPRLQAAVEHLAGLVRPNGWPCAACAHLGKWHGPGRRTDPCPYATLLMLRLLALRPEWRKSEPARTGVEALLSLWERRRETKPYLFGMGSDFAKLKAPLVWYDLLHVLDVMTQYPQAPGDPRLAEMVDLLRGKAGADGRFTPESVWLAWKGWDFGQKKAPSAWVTLLAQRVLMRVSQ